MRAYHARFSSRYQEFSTYPKDRKKTFPQPKIFFRTAFLARSAISTKNKQPTPASRPHKAKGPDMHFSTEIVWKSVETCGKMTVNSPSFRQFFPSPTLHSHRNFRVPRSARDHFLPRIFSSSPPANFQNDQPAFFYHQRKIHARISSENPSIKIRPYFRQKPAKNPHEIRKNH